MTHPPTWKQYAEAEIRRRMVECDCSRADAAYGIDMCRDGWWDTVTAAVESGVTLRAGWLNRLEPGQLRELSKLAVRGHRPFPAGYVFPHCRPAAGGP